MLAERRRVCIVDDSTLDAERARRCLADEYEVEVFSDGASVLERLASNRPVPGILILDWVMPGVSGLDVCRFVRASGPPLASIPVLLLTVHQRTDQVVEALEAGANDFVSKPFAQAELRARVDALVRAQALLEQVESAKTELREILSNSPDALLVARGDGRVLLANAEAEELFGAPASALAGSALGALLPGVVEWKEELVTKPDLQLGERCFEPGVRRTGDGADERWILTLRDVTAQRERERERLDVYSVVAHELRSPLSAALMRMQVLLDGAHGPLAPKQKDELWKVQRNVSELIGLINEFLELARDDASTDTHYERVCLRELVEETVEEYRPLAAAAALELLTELPSIAVPIWAPKRRLKQVLINLTSNAIKFTPRGGRVRVALSEEDACAVIEVRDTGLGIPPELVPELFGRYTRGGDHDAIVGTGLGLMIVRQTVEALGGRVGVRSEEGHGSTFWVRLPLRGSLRSAQADRSAKTP